MIKAVRKVPSYWWALMLVASLLCGGIYITGQQLLRQTANDPQIQIAQDTAFAIAHGADMQQFVSGPQVELTRSLATFVMIYDDSYQRVESTALLNDHELNIPAGVLRYTNEHGEDRITWQPMPDVRLATVVVKMNGSKSGFVVVGRSLKEVENRSWILLRNVFLGWIVILLSSLVAAIYSKKHNSGA